ncbi:hypothetical protein L596_019915 [Steinernema carpocapsae]|uniref:Uncharacterized protein n=1 Tax=Steinernema carpocapsae TaxID=34508 RepID=A0A4U5MS71_STECR|nr:hypothetical protein L596_019915 [Steinernema carpocapsae]
MVVHKVLIKDLGIVEFDQSELNDVSYPLFQLGLPSHIKMTPTTTLIAANVWVCLSAAAKRGKRVLRCTRKNHNCPGSMLQSVVL